MRYTTTPRWVYVMLIVMGIGFAAGAVPFWLFVPVSGHFVALVWLLMGFCFVFFSLRALARGRDDERLRCEGLRATATLLSANTTGWMINNVPQWKLRLRIDGAGASYETTMKLTTYNPPDNGAGFTVRVDPRNPQHIVMASDADDATSPAAAGAPANDGAETVRLLGDLDRMHASGSIGDAEFDALKRKLLGES